MEGFENIDIFTGGEENWQNWSWKVRTAVSGLCSDLAAQTHEGHGVKPILDENNEFMEVDHVKFIKASREMYGTLPRHTGSAVATIARSAMGLDGVEVWSRLHASYSRKVRCEWMHPKVANTMNHLMLTIMQWQGEW